MKDKRDLLKQWLPSRLKFTQRSLGIALIGIALMSAAIAIPRLRKTSSGSDNVATLRQEAREEPNNAKTRLNLGHALFEQGRRGPAIKSYDKALSRESEIGDEKMYDNLASCFGTAEQGEAASLIVRHKLVKMHERLSALAKNKHHKTRWAAVETLEKIGKASGSDFVRAWIADLDSTDCEIRQRAVEQLGKAGDRHALQAIRNAKKEDEKTRKGFLMFSSTCLGDRPVEAEKQILAHR